MATKLQARFGSIEADWDAKITPLFIDDPQPPVVTTTWDSQGAFARRANITIYVASDMASLEPVQQKIDFYFSYISREDSPVGFNRMNKAKRFKLVMIYGKDGSPNPEDITPDLRGPGPAALNKYYRMRLRQTIRQAIVTKLEAKPEEIHLLEDTVNFHTMNVKASKR